MQKINDEIIEEEQAAVIVEDITPRDLLTFAKLILAILAFLWLVGGYYRNYQS
jgi:hypothetical protein